MTIVKYLLLLLLGLTPVAFADSPGVGDPAPAFELQASDGNAYTLDQFRGKMGVVIAFFPKAFTGG